MKVLHVTRDYPPRSHGGLSSAVAGWVRAHEAEGIEAAVLSFDAYRPKRGVSASTRVDTSAAHVLRIDGPADADALLAFAREQGPRLLHLHDGFLLEPAQALCAHLELPLLLSVHVLQRELMTLRGLETPTASALAEERALQQAHGVTAPSPSALASLDATYASVPAARRVLPLVIAPPEAPVSAQRMGCPSVLFAGRFADVKGVREFLAAAVRIGAQVPTARFALAGGLPASPKAQRRFEAGPLRAARDALGERLVTLGWCDAAALDAAYRRAHVLVAPSWSETFGQCAFEALARATPLVTTRVGAYRDYLEPERECLQVEPRRPDALADAVVALLRDPARAARLGSAGTATARHFTPEAVGRALARLYADVVAQPQA